MCNVLSNIQIIKPYMQGRSLEEMFPAHFMQRNSYSSVIPYHCISCNRALSHDEMFPRGRTPRAMCPECYAKWTATVTDACPVCGDYLEALKIQNQKGNPKEVSYRLHDGRCLDYFSILSGKALGQDMSFLRNNVIEAVYETTNGLPSHTLPSPQQRLRALPSQAMLLDHQPLEFISFSQVGSTYKGKKVKVVAKHRQKKSG